ncbi:MAG TPA: imidazoleglycerol-phosphate dehydratase [Candidatus Omnitrophota bacterium]|nr:imidazoleglycerol-phosphate dehydratase [Candidatus Omnitrophota bacterium]MDD4941803.1 imidazoleglycerol-phosphate dehydratase [Candidatus Omnitrophota bacterium]HNQ50740.1 imidazoleglycerol-phosphate dehydratase [Candidatus Omnitrophota bacterium]HQO37854.1 imidazoleglycerol-phosphate dehydratase [Candidatus Omnitrophota bacterium]HQQ06939.1 imidazoleglycerol-phosphate dehydratase [Candidatus Omnitrophota bacterium]
MKNRKATVRRRTRETDITVKLNIDGSGKNKIDTGIGFLDHMLELFAFWGFFDLEISARGDLKVDIHHTNEDIGIVLGQAFKHALGDKKGIRRFGYAGVPMEEVVGKAVLDINGRGFFDMKTSMAASKFIPSEGYRFGYAEHFFDGLAKHLGMNLNIRIEYPNRDIHAVLEPVFKALGLALDQATQIDPRRKGVPSTKGVID